MNKTKRKVATTAQIIKCNIRLKEILDIVDGGVRYHTSWTDVRVGEEIGISSIAVARVRKSMYGELVAKTSKTNKSQLDKIEDFLVSLDMGYVK